MSAKKVPFEGFADVHPAVTIKVCPRCGKVFTSPPKRQNAKFCSIACQRLFYFRRYYRRKIAEGDPKWLARREQFIKWCRERTAERKAKRAEKEKPAESGQGGEA